MRLPDDDEVYEIDGSYLGPPGRYIAVMRYKAIFLWLILGPLTFYVMRMLDIPMTLLTVGLAAIAVTGVVGSLADRISQERSFTDLLRTFWQEVTTPRPDSKVQEAHGVDLRVVGRPPKTRRGKSTPRQAGVFQQRSDEHKESSDEANI